MGIWEDGDEPSDTIAEGISLMVENPSTVYSIL
jgi:hypothetical protein